MLPALAPAKPFLPFFIAWALAAAACGLDSVAPRIHFDWAVQAICLIFLESPHVFASFGARSAIGKEHDLTGSTTAYVGLAHVANYFRGTALASIPLWVFCGTEVLIGFVVWMKSIDAFFALLTYRAVLHNIAQTEVVCHRLWRQVPLGPGTASVCLWSVRIGMWVPALLWWTDEHRGMDWYHWQIDHLVKIPSFFVPVLLVVGCGVLLVLVGSLVVLWQGHDGDSERDHALRSVLLAAAAVATWGVGLHIVNRAAAFALLTVPHALPSLGNSFGWIFGGGSTSSSATAARKKQAVAFGYLIVIGGLEYWLTEYFVHGPEEYDAFFLYALPQMLHMQLEPLLCALGDAPPITSATLHIS